MRCIVFCGSTSFPWLVFFFGAVLWGSMIHKHTGRWMLRGSASVVSWNWGKYSCHSKLVSTLSMLLLSVLSWKALQCKVETCTLMNHYSHVSRLGSPILACFRAHNNHWCRSVQDGISAPGKTLTCSVPCLNKFPRRCVNIVHWFKLCDTKGNRMGTGRLGRSLIREWLIWHLNCADEI